MQGHAFGVRFFGGVDRSKVLDNKVYRLIAEFRIAAVQVSRAIHITGQATQPREIMRFRFS